MVNHHDQPPFGRIYFAMFYPHLGFVKGDLLLSTHGKSSLNHNLGDSFSIFFKHRRVGSKSKLLNLVANVIVMVMRLPILADFC